MSMSLKAELETWVRALAAYDAQDYEVAIALFRTIADSSKILTNMGLIYSVMGNHTSAIESFGAAVALDHYLAVAYFQSGVSNFVETRYELAMRDFDVGLEALRGNNCIKYAQLGLDFTLYAAELLFNRGLCQISLGLVDEGLADLRAASRVKAEPGHDVIDECIRVQGDGFTVFSISIGVLFRPSDMKIKNSRAKDYLGKAILLATDDERNAFTGFSGVELLRRGEGPTGLRVDTTAVDDRRPAAAIVDFPRPRDEWIPPQTLTRSASTGNVSTMPVAGTLRRNRSAGAPVPDALLSRAGSIARISPFPVRPQDTSRAVDAGVLANIYDQYIDAGSTTQTAAGRAQAYPSSGLGFMDTPSPIARNPSGLQRRPTNGSATPRRLFIPRSKFTDTTYEETPDSALTDGGVGRIRVKLHWHDDVRGMAVAPNIPYAEFTDRVRSKFAIQRIPAMKFADEDGAKVSLVDESDFELAIETTTRENPKGKPLEIWCTLE